MLAWPNSLGLRKLCEAFCDLKTGTLLLIMWQKPAEWNSVFRNSGEVLSLLKLSGCCSRCHIKRPPTPPSPGAEVSVCARGFSYHQSVNTAHPNTVKLISSHHRGSFWHSDKSILSLIINCDTHNHWKAAALNKWHVFCVIILCILTNMTH